MRVKFRSDFELSTIIQQIWRYKMKRLLILTLAVLTLCTACQQEEKKVALDNSFRLLVKFNGKYGYCDRGGILVIPPQYEAASIFSEGLAAVACQRQGWLSSIPRGRW